MFLLRIIALLAALLVGGLALAWVFTRDRKYLVLAWRVGQWLVVLAIVLALLYVFERVLLM